MDKKDEWVVWGTKINHADSVYHNVVKTNDRIREEIYEAFKERLEITKNKRIEVIPDANGDYKEWVNDTERGQIYPQVLYLGEGDDKNIYLNYVDEDGNEEWGSGYDIGLLDTDQLIYLYEIFFINKVSKTDEGE